MGQHDDQENPSIGLPIRYDGSSDQVLMAIPAALDVPVLITRKSRVRLPLRTDGHGVEQLGRRDPRLHPGCPVAEALRPRLAPEGVAVEQRNKKLRSRVSPEPALELLRSQERGKDGSITPPALGLANPEQQAGIIRRAVERRIVETGDREDMPAGAALQRINRGSRRKLVGAVVIDDRARRPQLGQPGGKAPPCGWNTSRKNVSGPSPRLSPITSTGITALVSPGYSTSRPLAAT